MAFFRCFRNRLVNHQHFGIILPQDGFQGVQLIHSWIQDHIRVLFEFPIHPDKCRMDLRFWDTPHGAVRGIPIMGSAGPCHQAFRSFSPDKWRPAFLTNYFSGKWILTSRWFLPFRFLLQKILHFFKPLTLDDGQMCIFYVILLLFSVVAFSKKGKTFCEFLLPQCVPDIFFIA